MKRNWVGVGVGAVVAGVVACGGGDDVASDLLENAGQFLVDAGRDADGSAAADVPPLQVVCTPNETHEVACMDVLEQTQLQDGDTTRVVTRLAKVETGTQDITGVDAIVCGKEGEQRNDPCPPGASCSGTAQIRTGDCQTVPAVLDGDKVMVSCGTYTEVNGALQPGYQRWKTARITIRR